jgi:hypothetical protein
LVVGIADVLAKAARPLRALSAFGPRCATDARDRNIDPGTRTKRLMTASRLIMVLALISLGATFVFAWIGYTAARNSDERLWIDQRIALRNAVSEFRALFGHSGEVDPRFVRMVEQGAGTRSLRFELAPKQGPREMQPVLDADGRIVGFFTWERSYPMTQSMDRLLPFVFGVAVLIIGFAGVSLRQLRHASRELVAREE